MDHDSDKLWLQRSLNAVAISRATDAIVKLGSFLPCRVTAVSGSIVTVAFEVNYQAAPLPPVTIPKLESQWIRCPTQVGDYGLTVGADAFLSAVAGQGGGTPNLMQRPGNLGALAFLPVASTTFPAVNTNQAFVMGPQGVVLQNQSGNVSLTLSDTLVEIKVNNKTWKFNTTGLAISTGIVMETHQHSGVQTGGSNTGGPVA